MESLLLLLVSLWAYFGSTTIDVSNQIDQSSSTTISRQDVYHTDVYHTDDKKSVPMLQEKPKNSIKTVSVIATPQLPAQRIIDLDEVSPVEDDTEHLALSTQDRVKADQLALMVLADLGITAE